MRLDGRLVLITRAGSGIGVDPAVLLASDLARYVKGVILPVDSGFLAC